MTTRNKKETIGREEGPSINRVIFWSVSHWWKSQTFRDIFSCYGNSRLPCINAFSVYRQETHEKKVFVGSTGLDEKCEFTLEQFHVIASSPPLMILCSKETISNAK